MRNVVLLIAGVAQSTKCGLNIVVIIVDENVGNGRGGILAENCDIVRV